MKNGLKGVTDATVFCKSMKKGGPKAMIQPMSKYMAGGVTGTTGLQTADSQSSDNSDTPLLTKIKRGIRKIKNNIGIYNYQNKSKNTKSKRPGGGGSNYNKLRNQQKSENNRCTGGRGCVGE